MSKCCPTKSHAKKIYSGFASRRQNEAMLSAVDTFYSYRDAVVSIYTQTTFATGQTGVEETVSEQGTGFFVAAGTIVTAAHVVMVDNSSGLRIPAVPAAYSDFARCDKIWVRVSNVNFKGETYYYPANITMVSPSLDIAILCIDNSGLSGDIKCCKGAGRPKLCEHLTLKWASNRKTAIGEKVFVLGDNPNRESIGIAEGVVKDNLYADNKLDSSGLSTYWGFEAVMGDVVSQVGNSGSPLFNAFGEVIGVVSGLDSYGGIMPQAYSIVAVSSCIAQRVLKASTEGCNPHRQYLTDPLGNYYRYRYGWLGITGFESFSPDVLRAVPDSKFRLQSGFIITELDAASPLNQLFQNLYTFPIATPPVAVTSDNEIYLVTELQGCRLGVDEGHFPFSSVTSKYMPEDKLTLKFRRGSENFECEYCACVILAEFPFSEDLAPPQTASVSALNTARDLDELKNLQERGMFKDIGIDLLRVLLAYGGKFTNMLAGGKDDSSESLISTLEAALNSRTDPQ